MSAYCFFAAPLVLLSSSLFAQTPDTSCRTASDCPPQIEGNAPTIIVTGTGAAQRLEESGLAITLFNDAQIARAQSTTVADLIGRAPGITISNTGPVGGFAAVRIRGAEGEQTLVLIDGVRANDPGAPGGGFDFGNLLIGNIEQIEILRGPNSVPWGSQAIGGVVNIVTRRAQPGIAANIRAEFGSHNRTILVGNVSGSIGPALYSVGAGGFRNDGISAATSGDEADGYRQHAVNGRVELSLTDQLHLDLRAYHADSRAELDGFPAPDYQLADTGEYSTIGQTTAYAGLHLTLGPIAQRLSATLNDINRANFSSPNASTADFLARGRSERIEYQGDWQVRSGLRAIFGAEHERSRFTDGFSPAQTHYSGAYAQIVAEPLPDITLTGGARFDTYDSYGSKTIFSANAIWRPSASSVVRVAYGEGFKAPTLFQLFSFFGDKDLQPEEAKSVELGFEQSALNGALRIGATAYRRRTRNMIDFDLLLYRYDNILRNRAKGIEGFIEMRPATNWMIGANYSYTDSRGRQNDTGPFVRRIRIPLHKINLKSDWQPTDQINVGADLQLAGDSLDGFGGSVRMDGYTLVNLRGSYRIVPQIELFGRVENVGDTRYQTVAGYGSYRRTAFVGVRAGF